MISGVQQFIIGNVAVIRYSYRSQVSRSGKADRGVDGSGNIGAVFEFVGQCAHSDFGGQHGISVFAVQNLKSYYLDRSVYYRICRYDGFCGGNIINERFGKADSHVIRRHFELIQVFVRNA